MKALAIIFALIASPAFGQFCPSCPQQQFCPSCPTCPQQDCPSCPQQRPQQFRPRVIFRVQPPQQFDPGPGDEEPDASEPQPPLVPIQQPQPLPAPPPLANPPITQPAVPAQPPAPTVDTQALKDQQKQFSEHFEKIERSLIVIQSKDGGCQCNNAKLETEIHALAIAIAKQTEQHFPTAEEIAAAIKIPTPVTPAPETPVAPVAAHRLYLRAVPLN